MVIGWMPLKGRETGARFTAPSGTVHPFGLSTSSSMRTDVVQPLLVFDTEHLRYLTNGMTVDTSCQSRGVGHESG